MARPERPAWYGRYLGGPDPLAPPLDLGEALDAVSEGVMSGYSPKQALREFLRRGGREQLGLDDLSGQVQQRRRELLRRHRLGGTLDEVAKLLDKALLAERSQLARDARMDPTDRTLREMTIENLPESTAGKVAGLSEYEWASSDGRETYKQIQDLLGREALESRFAGMKRALENAGESEREAVTEMLEDLNELLELHARGEDTDEDFADFMSRYGDYFPENPKDVDELIDVLAQRSAAAQRMLQSMSEEQRNELMNLSAQAFGSADIQNQLSALDANLRRLRPDEDWDGAAEFTGDEPVGYGEGTSVMAELGELDALSDQLGDWGPESPLSELDIEALERHLGHEAAVSARTLSELEKSMQDSGYLRSNAEGDLRLSPAAMRKLGKSLLRDAATRLSGRTGTRDTRASGAAGEQTGASRPWHFGDTESWNVPRTISNAITRTAGEGGDLREGLRLAPSDIEVNETEARTQAAVVLLVDTSFSMVMEGRWVPMKRTALALHHLVSTRFRGDDLELITFGRYAQRVEIGALLERDVEYEQGTNLHHALLLAGQFFRKHPTMQPVLLVVTDGEPTAHLEPGGEPWFSYPPARETIATTVAELDRIARFGAQVTFFRLGENPGLARFLDAMARRVHGTVVAPDLEDLGAAVVEEFLSSRFGPDFGDLD